VIKAVFILILILFALNSISVQAKVYKYIDENGQVHYSGTKPVNKRSKQLNIQSKRSGRPQPKAKKIKLIATKNLNKAVREGRITEKVAIRMRHFNFVSKEYSLLKKKKKAMKMAIASAKSIRSGISAEQIKHLEKQYDNFIKEDFYYVRRNFMVSRKKIQTFLASHSRPESSSSKKNNNKPGASIEWR